MNLIFLGPPGSGKGTLAANLHKLTGLPHISTGEMLRGYIRAGAPLGLRAKAFIDKGELVPDELVIEMVRERLSADDCKNGYMLDGFPRTVPQAEILDGFQTIERAVLLNLDDETIIARLSGRRVCSACGNTYHTSMLGESTACGKCGGLLVQRPDDSEATIRNRLRVYHSQTAPLVEYYRGKGILSEMSVEGTVEDNTGRLLRLLGMEKS